MPEVQAPFCRPRRRAFLACCARCATAEILCAHDSRFDVSILRASASAHVYSMYTTVAPLRNDLSGGVGLRALPLLRGTNGRS